MLQQTQTSRVLEKFEPFIARFPTIRALAAAEESDVLAEWSGLGYYRRARLLHAAAKTVVDRFEGTIPADPAVLRSIPGLGRYTAGAIASIVFDRPTPLVDGNVVRVLSRLHARDGSADEPSTMNWCWEQASIVARSTPSPALTNEGMMELGATVCTPRNPACSLCPLRDLCLAHATDRQSEIPRPKRKAARRTLQHACVLVTDHAGRVLMEQRPAVGLWASMWQTPTLEHEGDEPATIGAVAAALGLSTPGSLRLVHRFVHSTSHREVRVSVWSLDTLSPRSLRAAAKARPGSNFLDPASILSLARSNLQHRVLEKLTQTDHTPDSSPRSQPGVPRKRPLPKRAPNAPRSEPRSGTLRERSIP